MPVPGKRGVSQRTKVALTIGASGSGVLGSGAVEPSWNTTVPDIEFSQGTQESVDVTPYIDDFDPDLHHLELGASSAQPPAGVEVNPVGSVDYDGQGDVASVSGIILSIVDNTLLTFSQRKAYLGADLLRAFDWGDPAELGAGPNGYGYQYNYGWYPDSGSGSTGTGSNNTDHPVIDNSIYPPGGAAASLRFTGQGDGSGNPTAVLGGGLWVTNFSDDLSVFIRDGQSVFCQWRQRMDDNWVNVNPFAPSSTGLGAWGGGKHCLVSRGARNYTVTEESTSANSCTSIEVCAYPYSFANLATGAASQSMLGAYYGCPGTPGVTNFEEPYGGTDFKLENARASPYCLYSQKGKATSFSPGTCFPYVANTWMTYQIGIELGTARDDWPTLAAGNNARLNGCRFRFWGAHEGGGQELLIDMTKNIYFPTTEVGYGKFWLTTRYSWMNYWNHIRRTWYGQVLIARRFCPDAL